MANYWILKTEPSTYSFDQLEREQAAVWDGVRNNLALKHLRQMKRGDRALIYHSGAEKAVIGIADIASAPYPDPKLNDPKLVVVEITVAGRLPRSVPLAEIKQDRTLSDLALVRMGRLSVMPATRAQWQRLLKMGDSTSRP